MPNEPQSDQTIPPVPTVVNIGERQVNLGSVPEIAATPVEPSVAVLPEGLGSAPPINAVPQVVVRDEDSSAETQEKANLGDFSHLPAENRFFGVAQVASNWIRRILGREERKGALKHKAKTT